MTVNVRPTSQHVPTAPALFQVAYELPVQCTPWDRSRHFGTVAVHDFNLGSWGVMAAERADALVPSVFQALRTTLAAQIAAPSSPAKCEPLAQMLNEWPAEAAASGPQAQRPLASSTNALFAQIAHRHQSVHESTQLHIAEQTKRRVIESIRRRRSAQRRVRESAIQRLQQHKMLMANDCRLVLMQAEAKELKFQQHTTQLQEQATARLQVLFLADCSLLCVEPPVHGRASACD